jgi:hypothetical protein
VNAAWLRKASLFEVAAITSIETPARRKSQKYALLVPIVLSDLLRRCRSNNTLALFHHAVASNLHSMQFFVGQ